MKPLARAAKRAGRPPVLIRWLDSSGPNGWSRTEERTDEPFVVETLGWELAKNEKGITVAAHVADARNGNEQHHSVITIPRRAIVKYRRL